MECGGCATRSDPGVLAIDYSGVLRPLPVEWLRRFVATAVRRAEPQHLRRREVAISLVQRALGSHYSSFDLDVDVLKVGTEPPIEEFASVAPRYSMGSRDAAVQIAARVLYADGVPPRADLEWITDLGHTAGIPDDRLAGVLTEVARAPG